MGSPPARMIIESAKTKRERALNETGRVAKFVAWVVAVFIVCGLTRLIFGW